MGGDNGDNGRNDDDDDDDDDGDGDGDDEGLWCSYSYSSHSSLYLYSAPVASKLNILRALVSLYVENAEYTELT